MKHRKKPAAAPAAAIPMFTLAACGEGEAAGQAQADQTASNGDGYNDSDVDFATGMTPHHAQALAMELESMKDRSFETWTDVTSVFQRGQSSIAAITAKRPPGVPR